MSAALSGLRFYWDLDPGRRRPSRLALGCRVSPLQGEYFISPSLVSQSLRLSVSASLRRSVAPSLRLSLPPALRLTRQATASPARRRRHGLAVRPPPSGPSPAHPGRRRAGRWESRVAD